MEYVSGGTANCFAKALAAKPENEGHVPEWAIARITKGVASALSYLHKKRIVHGDIKDDNILITSFEVVKLTDFGQAVTIDPNVGLTECCWGTSQHRVPELMSNTVGHMLSSKRMWRKCGTPVDVWALGVTMSELTTPNEIDFEIFPHYGMQPS
ncbi:unnamed protein product, partial [Choristocarpus tenellus]